MDTKPKADFQTRYVLPELHVTKDIFKSVTNRSLMFQIICQENDWNLRLVIQRF